MDKNYKEGLQVALDVLNEEYFAATKDRKRIQGKISLRKKINKADKLGTAEACVWNWFKSVKERIAELGELERTDIIEKNINHN